MGKTNVYSTFSKNISTWIFLCLVWMQCAMAKGQDSALYSVNYPEVTALLYPVSASANAAAMYVLPQKDFGYLDVGISHKNGAFKPTMTEKVSNHFKFSTEKYVFLKNTVLYGSFSGNKKWDKDVNYSNVSNPYRGTPYLMVDTVGGDNYDREFYNLKGAVAQAFGKSIIGASVDYNIELAAQNRDPRAKNVVTSFNFKPGYLLQLQAFSVGLNLGFDYYNEEINVKNIEQARIDNMYYLLGLRSAITLRDNSFLRKYMQYGYNAEMQFTNKWLTVFAGGEMSNETVDDGEFAWAVQRNFARLKGGNFYLNGVFTFTPKSNIHQLTFNTKVDKHKGTEIIQKKELIPPFDNVKWVTLDENLTYSKRQQEFGLHYCVTKMKSAYTRNYAVGFQANYYNELEEYLLLNDEKSVSNLALSAYFYKLFTWENSMLSVRPKLSYQLNLQSNLDITDPSELPGVTLPDYYLTIEEMLVRPDYNYFSSSYFSPELRVTFEKDMKKSKNKIFIKGDLKWILPEDSSMGYRQFLSASVGITL